MAGRARNHSLEHLWLIGSIALCTGVSNASEREVSTNRPATLSINITNGSVLAGQTQLTGTVANVSNPLDHVEIELLELARDKVISLTGTISPTAGNEIRWSTKLPRVRDGRYELRVQAFLEGDVQAASSIRRTILIDDSPPEINFFPLHDQLVVGDFSEIGGEIDESASIRFSICRVNDLGELSCYWNGAGWETNRDLFPIQLTAASTSDFWFASAEATLPQTSQIPAGNYLLSVFAFDRAGNEGRAAVTVSKRSSLFSAKTVAP